MTALDLCQPHYQKLLIIYLKFTTKSVKDAKKTKSLEDFISLKNNKLNYKWKECKKRQLKPINWLIEKLSNIYEFCNNDLNKFILLLRIGLYPYE